ncbi:hypothetical protein [Nitrospira sp. BLG_2]|uniref:hypothetical protein n=1 Tax=Nitrospira sp. BLG_2 TaxID=3397507 RepID=UPI003B99A373
MISVGRYTIIAVLCGSIYVPSVYAKDAGVPHDDRHVKESHSQVSGAKTIRGRVIKAEEGSLTIEEVNDKETVITIDPKTRTNHNFHPGDRITATVTQQGRAVEVQKEGKPEP